MGSLCCCQQDSSKGGAALSFDEKKKFLQSRANLFGRRDFIGIITNRKVE